MKNPLIGQENIWNQMITLIDAPEHYFIIGPPGSGKSLLARSFLQYYAHTKNLQNKELWGKENTEGFFMLGSEQDRGIQSVRNRVLPFIRRTPQKSGVFNWILIDDVDTFPNISQQALRRPMEINSHITRFIYIGNSQNALIPPLQSRCICMKMCNIDILKNMQNILSYVSIPREISIDYDILIWLINSVGGNIKSMIKILRMSKNIYELNNHPCLMKKLIKIMSPVPMYLDFYTIIECLSTFDIVNGVTSLIKLWNSGYSYEDILEGIDTIKNVDQIDKLSSHIIITQFLINSWISYTKGETSIVSLQYIYYKTISDYLSNPLFNDNKYQSISL